VLLALSVYNPEIHRGVARFGRDHNWHIPADLEDAIPKSWNGDGVLTQLGARQEIWRPLRRLDVPIVDLGY
jgi:LacI family transcriptional regulator